MTGLERNSHGDFRCAVPGRMRHGAAENLPRHCHREPFAAVVLAGGYDEAGDTGRHRVSAGDVIVHRPFESHLDLFHRPGADVLVVPLPHRWTGPTLATLADVDALARLAEKSAVEAIRALEDGMTARPTTLHDWPDALAAALRQDPSTCLDRWAGENGLHPGSLGRGFASVFGISAAGYRLVQRVQQAIHSLVNRSSPLSVIAAECGFSDQSHMTRAIGRLTGATPTALRRHLTK